MSFGEDLRLFADKVHLRSRAMFVGSVTHVHRSVTDGSEITTAPGQPVDTGNLRASWLEFYPEEWVGEVSTITEYAPAIEDGQQQPYTTKEGTYVEPQPMTLRSAVGGFHSVKLTRANWDRLVDHEADNARRNI